MLADAVRDAPPPLLSAAPRADGVPHYRVLVVDDSPSVRSSLRALLAGTGRARFDLLTAQNGIEALKLLAAATAPVDLIVTDLTMPQMDGLAFIRQLRGQAEYAEVPILFLTAHTEDDKKLEAFRLGATDYVIKPFLPPELESRIMGYLERKRALETIREHERVLRLSVDQARLTQAALLPATMPALPGAAIAAKYVPVEELGGDYYDFYALEDGRLGVLLADVSGHGISAALVSFLLAGVFKNNAPGAPSPESLLGQSNAMVAGKIPEGRYATALYATLDTRARRLAYSAAGHPPPILIRSAEARVEALSLSGSPLGLVEANRVHYERGEIDLAPGDRILFHSDGLGNDGHTGAGSNRFKRFILENAGLAPSALLDAVYAFGLPPDGRGQYSDDVTLILLALDPA